MVTAAGELVALLTKLTEPFAAPEICGVKITLTVLPAPAAIESGKVTPPIVYPVPVTFPAETETEPVPLFVRVTVFVLGVPFTMFPNAREVGETLSKNVVGAVPEPVSDMVGAAVDELLVIAMEPFNAPVVVGANTTLPTAEALGARVKGRMKPLTLYAAPVGVRTVTLRSAVPVFFSVKGADVVVPVVMLPKAILVGVTDI